MFKNKSYTQDKNIIKIPKHIEKYNIKNEIKPNVNKNNYENIRNIVENKQEDSISKPKQKTIKNKLNIV